MELSLFDERRKSLFDERYLPNVSNLLLISVPFVALGVAITVFEALVANNHANFHPCSQDTICDLVVVQDPLSIGLFPVIAGAIMIGLQKALKGKQILDSTQAYPN